MTHRRELGVIAASLVTILGAVTMTVLFGVRVTAGWTDQSGYHWPTIAKMIRELPSVDIVNVATATGPLYHLSLAVPARIFTLSEGAVQILSAVYGCGLAALVSLAGRGMPLAPRIAATSVVLLSPYFWESTLWMATDVAAMTFAFAALTIFTRPQVGRWEALLAGLLVAGAVGVRQTFGWLILVAAIALWFADPAKPLRERLLGVLAGTVPGGATLIGLVVAWRGLLPPPLVPLNATHPSPAGLTYMFALAACYLLPLTLALGGAVWRRGRDLTISVVVGFCAAAPGMLFASSEVAGDGKPRSGGWLWVLVARVPAPHDRSILLVGLAFAGGVAFSLLTLHIACTNSKRIAAVLGVALVAAAVFASAGSQMYQKYYEVPLVLIVFLVARETFRARPKYVSVLAIAPLILQLGAVIAIVCLPYWRALASTLSGG